MGSEAWSEPPHETAWNKLVEVLDVDFEQGYVLPMDSILKKYSQILSLCGRETHLARTDVVEKNNNYRITMERKYHFGPNITGTNRCSFVLLGQKITQSKHSNTAQRY